MSKKYLIGQLACYGDCLFATTIAKQIKHDYKDAHITWAIASKYKSILHLNPDVDSIWEIPIVDGDYYIKGWAYFEKEVTRRKSNGDFDVIIYSQIPPLNWIHFTGTIRSSILRSYGKAITVDVAPVVRLSDLEVEHVKLFATQNNLNQYKHVILFECNPGSNQSKMNPTIAEKIARTLTEKNKDLCFILTTPQKLRFTNPQIIDASTLSFRENAELTKFCTLLVGCSSGITWLSTSDWAKKLPMLQLIDRNAPVFAGIHFDFEVNKIETSLVIELIDFDENSVRKNIDLILHEDFSKVKSQIHQEYKPTAEDLFILTNKLNFFEIRIKDIALFVFHYIVFNYKNNNNLKVNPFFYCNMVLRMYLKKHYNEISFENSLWNSCKYLIKNRFLKRYTKV